MTPPACPHATWQLPHAGPAGEGTCVPTGACDSRTTLPKPARVAAVALAPKKRREAVSPRQLAPKPIASRPLACWRCGGVATGLTSGGHPCCGEHTTMARA